MIAAAITDVPGASAFFRGGLVTYANEWKQAFLGVSAECVSTHGAVSAETASAMLQGLFSRYGVEAGAAVTGVAGPGGGTPDTPGGLVFVATGVGDDSAVRRYLFPPGRDGIRRRTVTAALDQLRRQLLTASREERATAQ